MSNNDTKTAVMEMLHNFRENQIQIKLLHYEMEHPATITPTETIESLALGHAEGLGGSSGHISNKTLYIALNYQEKTDQANAKVIEEIAIRLNALERQQERLIHYVSLLDENEAAVIRMTYMEGMTNEQIAEALELTKRTVFLRRNKAIEHLCDMYEYTMGLNQG